MTSVTVRVPDVDISGPDRQIGSLLSGDEVEKLREAINWVRRHRGLRLGKSSRTETFRIARFVAARCESAEDYKQPLGHTVLDDRFASNSGPRTAMSAFPRLMPAVGGETSLEHLPIILVCIRRR
ncbi:MAG: hypothetical protein GY788_23640 [bacterium]|nr:hypothetical protein [bacterium]